ncbi:DUF421 domain-containing protein [Rudanella paleaurantiibacter]|uniref:DUF421 domain-containing protein n=1 Tax=Rudanella paleaurantiibacter TaxID=2614655 RepID=A0A7J5TWJ4_9BACT|nr:DUF421 domain-containing protein [Rudanella paleaurantiibacter]KAB7728769.1 DUF421 domain-containing protein [Rudanella paleaurantiibacter]
MKEPVQPFDWHRILIHDFPWMYLGEVALRTAIMFTVVLLALTISGKRSVKQLSVYELVLLIGLGSAAGDPMFYDDVPLSTPIVVFVVMMGCYKIITRLSDKNRRLRESLEGKPVYVIQNGCIETRNFDEEDLGQDELFSELRQGGIEHLGQVRLAILEPNGQLSVFRSTDDVGKPGLPILPHLLRLETDTLVVPGQYACTTCGHVQPFEGTETQPACRQCGHHHWVKAMG